MRLRRLKSPLNNLINCEGTILEILQEKETRELYACGLTAPGNSKILTKVNSFTLELYLKGRITLQELFVLRGDEHYIIRRHGRKKAAAKFLEKQEGTEANEIMNLATGAKLYPLLPRGMKPSENISTLIALLPKLAGKFDEEEIQDLHSLDSEYHIFQPNTTSFRIVNIESEELNEDEHSYFEATSHLRSEKILVRINDMALKLFLQGRISITEIFQLRMDDKYIIIGESGIKYSGYNSNVQALLQVLDYGNLTYPNLPDFFQVDSPLEQWRYFESFMINGKGILPAGFRHQYPVELNISN